MVTTYGSAPTGGIDFHPDPDAWERYGDLVRDTASRLDALGREAPTDPVPQPAGAPAPAAFSRRAVGYAARGDGDLCDLVASLLAGETSSEEETEHALTTAERQDGALHAVVALERERAMTHAAALDRLPADERGPLAGAPWARKDLFHRAGHNVECGATLFEGRVASTTATVVERLDAAGGVDIGRLAMAELAMSPTGFNVHLPHPCNAWDLDHVPGGSSSGSGIAVAASYVRAALGTDTGGSIRHPAAMSGVTGLKPTANRISRAGVWPLSWSLDCVGPLARSARDCALLLEILSGPDRRDLTVLTPGFHRPDLGGDLDGVRIGMPSGYYFDPLTAPIVRILEAARNDLRSTGAVIVDTTTPDMGIVNTMAHLVLSVEASAQLGHVFRDARCPIGRQVRDRLEPGLFYSATDYATALRLRARIRTDWLSKALADCDCVFLPAIVCEVPTIIGTREGDPTDIAARIAAVTHATRGINYLGLPAISVPCGFDATGLPVAFQLVGRADDEASLIRIADTYQRATDWHTRRPPDRAST